MKKKKFLITCSVFLIVIFSSVYVYASTLSISGKSDNGMWKYTYKKSIDPSEPTGWQGKLKQLDKQKVEVKELTFTDNDEILAQTDSFVEGTDIDGSVTTLHPFATEFYLGNSPERGHIYKMTVKWQKEGETYEDTFTIH
ncbi:hypothetical protein M3599_05220 [Niallia circulans]|uniref:hypothetical protein n=1 Tax=Niallia circulans TaxID=1397 RepID=UPI00203C231B|nr:hypothetical protein [Niallia circulans]MCM2980329.1 hypothetical protein [Niallia circulans]